MAQLHVLMRADTVRARPAVRTIGLADLKDALARGLADFSAVPTHAVFLCLIYPIVGLILARAIMGYALLPLMFPLAAGFALVGPFAAIGFYELSRRREQGLDISWEDAFDVVHSPSRDAIAALGLLLLVIFAIWIAVAQAIYIASFGYQPAASIPHFVRQVFTTPEGWMLMIGSLPFFFGLAVVVPVLGHSTWHLYRKVVEPDLSPRQEHPRPQHKRRYAAQFPAALFAGEDKEPPARS